MFYFRATTKWAASVQVSSIWKAKGRSYHMATNPCNRSMENIRRVTKYSPHVTRALFEKALHFFSVVLARGTNIPRPILSHWGPWLSPLFATNNNKIAVLLSLYLFKNAALLSLAWQLFCVLPSPLICSSAVAHLQHFRECTG